MLERIFRYHFHCLRERYGSSRLLPNPGPTSWPPAIKHKYYMQKCNRLNRLLERLFTQYLIGDPVDKSTPHPTMRTEW